MEDEKTVLGKIELLLEPLRPEHRVELLKTLLERHRIAKGVFSEPNKQQACMLEDDVETTLTSDGECVDDAMTWMEEAGALMRLFSRKYFGSVIDDVGAAMTKLKEDHKYLVNVVHHGFRVDDQMKAVMPSKVITMLEKILRGEEE